MERELTKELVVLTILFLENLLFYILGLGILCVGGIVTLLELSELPLELFQWNPQVFPVIGKWLAMNLATISAVAIFFSLSGQLKQFTKAILTQKYLRKPAG